MQWSILFVRKLEDVHKQVGGCLIAYSLCVRKLNVNRLSNQMRASAASIALNGPNGDSPSQSVSYVDIELLGQLKTG